MICNVTTSTLRVKEGAGDDESATLTIGGGLKHFTPWRAADPTLR